MTSYRQCSTGHFFLLYPGDARPPCSSSPSLLSEPVPKDDIFLSDKLVATLANYDPSDPFWVTLDFGGRMTQVDQGTGDSFGVPICFPNVGNLPI